MATERTSRILDEMHAIARDLHRLGFIDKRRMGELDASAAGVRKQRENNTRVDFAENNL